MDFSQILPLNKMNIYFVFNEPCLKWEICVFSVHLQCIWVYVVTLFVILLIVNICEYFCFIYSENTKVSTAPPGGVNDWICAFLLN